MKQNAVRRTAVVRGLAGVTVAAAFLLTGAVPVGAVPAPSAVEDQIDKQWNDLEPVIEQYNHVHGQLLTSRKKADDISGRLLPLQIRVDAALAKVGAMASDAYMQGRPAMGAMLISGSMTNLTDKLTFLNELARQQREAVSGVTTMRDRYEADKRELDSLTASLAARDADLAARKKSIESKIDDLQKLRIQAYGKSGGADGALRTGACPMEYNRDQGGRAAQAACKLIGTPYVWAAAGPGGTDCSGLTMMAWAKVGVSLNHFTRAQWSQTTPVSRAELRPGDLVFYYGDLHHVGIYVGGGTIVHAPHSGDRVRMAPIDRSPPAGFRRPG